MSHAKSRELVLAITMTDELLAGLERLRADWRRDPHSVPKGLACSESKEGQFVLVAAEAAFVTLPGACVVKGLGAIELVGEGPAFEEGASSKTLVLKAMPDGWRFAVKYVPPVVRERHQK